MSIARLALSERARDVAGTAGSLVPTAPDAHSRDGRLVEVAADIAKKTQKLLTFAVIYERARGVGWERIGTALGNVGHQAARERYEEAERDFHREILHLWLCPDRFGERSTVADSIARTVTRLNAWVAAHREYDDTDQDDEPVDSGLTPMSIAERSALITQAASLLQTMATDPGADARQRHEMETGLCRRTIELYEDLAVQNPGDADALAGLAEARTRLAELRLNGRP